MRLIKKWLPLLIVFLNPAGLLAQDILVTVYGERYEVRIKKITRETIHYSLLGDERKRTHKAGKDSLARVHFMDGDVHLYRFTRAEKAVIAETLNESSLYSFGKVQAFENYASTRSQITAEEYRVQRLVAKVTGFSYTSKSFGPMLEDPNYLRGYDDVAITLSTQSRRNNDRSGENFLIFLELLYLLAFFFN